MTSIEDALLRLWDADDGARLLQFDGHWSTWGAVRSLTERIDAELTTAGCGEGGRVAVVLSNRMESVAALIAILRGRRTLVTISPLQPPERLSADVAASRVSYVLAPSALWSEVVFTDAVTQLGAAGWHLDGGGLAAQAHRTNEPVPGDPAVAIEMLTSGTTGPPKRIPLTRAQLEASLASALQHNDRADARTKPPLSGTVGLVTLPIVHIGGLWSLLQSLVAARPFAMLDRFTVAGWHAVVKEHRPAVAGLPPAAMRSVLDADIPREDLDSIRAINAGTTAVDPDLVDAFYERYGIPILVVYGATEFSGAVAGWTVKDFHARWNDKKGSVGRAFPGVQLQIVDDDGAVLDVDEPGRLQVATPQAGGGGWITTSDLAHLDVDDFLYIDGRADDVIMRGGFKVAPETVVRALRAHPAVADAAVAPIPDARLGQIPVAAVELRARAEADEETLRAHCRTALTPYEVPARIFVVDELPRGAALKIDRRRLLAMLEDLGAMQKQPTRKDTPLADEQTPAALIERRGNVALITINRPEARNAVNGAVSTAVGDALSAAQDDPEVWAVVITGAGDKSFCAGADLKAISRGENLFHAEHADWGFAGYVHHFIDKPTIAAVNGTALGGGSELALASDLIVACESASFGLPEVKRGLIAGAGGVFRIVEQLPQKVALELVFTGEPLPAADALKWGLINQVVPDGTVVEAALALAERITVNAPLSVQASKRLAYGADDGVIATEEPKWDRTAREFTELLKTQDAKEGPLAFAEKRQPVWKAR